MGKHALKSTTIQGILLQVISGALLAAGATAEEISAVAKLTLLISGVVGEIVGMIMAIYGRAKAKESLRLGKNRYGSGTVQSLILLLCIMFALGGMVGCATTPAGEQAIDPVEVKDGLLTTKDVLILVAGTADNMCTVGLLDQGECDKANAAYQKAQVAYDTAADAMIAAMQVGTQEGWGRYQVFHENFRTIYKDMLTTAVAFGIIDPAAADTYKRIDNPEVGR